MGCDVGQGLLHRLPPPRTTHPNSYTRYVYTGRKDSGDDEDSSESFVGLNPSVTAREEPPELMPTTEFWKDQQQHPVMLQTGQQGREYDESLISPMELGSTNPVNGQYEQPISVPYEQNLISGHPRSGEYEESTMSVVQYEQPLSVQYEQPLSGQYEQVLDRQNNQPSSGSQRPSQLNEQNNSTNGYSHNRVSLFEYL